MAIDEHKSINELEELSANYNRDIEQLEGLYSRMRERYSKLSEINDNRHVDAILKPTVDSIRSIEEALHKLHDAGVGVEKLTQLYQAYLEVEL